MTFNDDADDAPSPLPRRLVVAYELSLWLVCRRTVYMHQIDGRTQDY